MDRPSGALSACCAATRLTLNQAAPAVKTPASTAAARAPAHRQHRHWATAATVAGPPGTASARERRTPTCRRRRRAAKRGVQPWLRRRPMQQHGLRKRAVSSGQLDAINGGPQEVRPVGHWRRHVGASTVQATGACRGC
eukprot:363203-Chlamydomonas_euryale.AAC.39